LKDLKQGKDIVYEGKKYKAKDLVYNEVGKKVSNCHLDTLFNSKIKKFVENADILILRFKFQF